MTTDKSLLEAMDDALEIIHQQPAEDYIREVSACSDGPVAASLADLRSQGHTTTLCDIEAAVKPR